MSGTFNNTALVSTQNYNVTGFNFAAADYLIHLPTGIQTARTVKAACWGENRNTHLGGHKTYTHHT